MSEDIESWERKALDKLLMQGIKEQRATRRWGIFFKILFFAYLIIVTYVSLYGTGSVFKSSGDKKVTAVIDIKGNIAPDKPAGAKDIIPLLRNAFEDSSTAGIILRINSPGGTPTQAHMITTEMERLRKEYPDTKIYAVIEELGASGAYWVASAADEIYADESSILGSIGVVVSSFGFIGTMEKLGVDRRLFTAGENKAMLDPFSPRDPEQEVMLEENLKDVHELFIQQVKTGRGDKLKETSDMFSGRIWLGSAAKDLGLIDGYGDVYTVSRNIVNAPELREYKSKPPLLSQITGKVSEMSGEVLSKVFGIAVIQ